MRHGFYVSLFVVLLLFTNIDARGGGRGEELTDKIASKLGNNISIILIY